MSLRRSASPASVGVAAPGTQSWFLPGTDPLLEHPGTLFEFLKMAEKRFKVFYLKMT